MPVRRLRSPVARFGLWLILVALVGGTLGLSGAPGQDLVRQLRDPTMLLEVALLASAGMAAAILALRAAVPGREASRFAPLVPLGLASAAVGLWCRLPMPQGDVAVSPFVARGLGCATRTLLLAAIPWCAC